MQPEASDEQLMLAFKSGDARAFRVLVQRHRGPVFNFILRYTGHKARAEDLLQETFVHAMAADRVPTEEELRPWLYRIALNQVRSEWRRRKHVSVIPFSPPQGNGDDVFDDAAEACLVSGEYFEEQVVQRDLIGRVLAQLPPASAVCLLLDAEGFSYREIAETQQDTLSAVRSRLSRARQAFQHLYRKLEQEERS